MFMFEPFNKLCVGIHKSGKEYPMNHLSFDGLRAPELQRRCKLSVKVWSPVLRGYILLFRTIESDWLFPGSVYIFRKEQHWTDGKEYSERPGYVGYWKGSTTDH